MSSPFVCRQRLGTELKALRVRKGLTTERLGSLIYQSRMKITRLEKAQVRPDLVEIMDLLDLLSASEEEQARILRIAKEAASRGWWDSFGDAMGPWQRLYADLESGAASIHEYSSGGVPALLRLPEFLWALVERDRAEYENTCDPKRMVEGCLRRQETVLHLDGPSYEVVLDEVGLRRFDLPADLIARQLRHITGLAERLPRVVIRVFPFSTGRVEYLIPVRQVTAFTFLDPANPPMVLCEVTPTEVVRPQEAGARYLSRYEAVRDGALPAEDSLALISEIAEQISRQARRSLT